MGNSINAINNTLSGQTGDGMFVGHLSPLLTMPDLGVPTAGSLINCINLPAANLVGNVPMSNLASGTSASAATYLRGDGSWQTPSSSVASVSVLNNSVIASGLTQSLVAGTVYTVTSLLGLCIMTLPTTCPVGGVIEIDGLPGIIGWVIAQNSGQKIIGGSLKSTTTGILGRLTGDIAQATVTLRCIVANTTFLIISTNSTPIFA